MTSNDLWRLDACELAAGIRTRRFTSREAVQSCLNRLDAVNPAINAVVDVLAEQALAAADAADRAVREGRALGVLHGVPITIKINVDLVGRPTSNGIVALRDLLPPENAPVVDNFLNAGAVIIGRTNAPAFSMRWFTDNALHGQTLNPWNAGITPGGSSGGASAAVAAGIGPIAHGNDLAGSVRYPAYCTGVYGLRPSFGRVPAFLPSAAAERALSAQLMSVQGPLTRSVRDLRLALQAMSVGDARDPWWVPAPLEGPALPEGGSRPRVAFTVRTGGTPATPEIEHAVRRAAAWLADAGYRVEEVDPPDTEEAVALWDTITMGESLHYLSDAVAKMADANMLEAWQYMGANTPRLDAFGHMKALARRSTLIRNWQRFMAQYPIVLTPVSAEPPFPQMLDVESQAGMDRVLAAQGPQFYVPVLGLPALSAPTGFVDGDEGSTVAGASGRPRTPLGVQLIGPRFREDLILAAAEVIEARCPVAVPVDPR
jgi:amidase